MWAFFMPKQILITTVWHSGSHSLRQHLIDQGLLETERDAKWLHCCSDALRLAQSGEYDCYTTYRDPYDIAASWVKRKKWPKYEKEWARQWGSYHRIKKHCTVINVDDLSHRLNQSEGRRRKNGDLIRIMGDAILLPFEET